MLLYNYSSWCQVHGLLLGFCTNIHTICLVQQTPFLYHQKSPIMYCTVHDCILILHFLLKFIPNLQYCLSTMSHDYNFDSLKSGHGNHFDCKYSCLQSWDTDQQSKWVLCPLFSKFLPQVISPIQASAMLHLLYPIIHTL